MSSITSSPPILFTIKRSRRRGSLAARADAAPAGAAFQAFAALHTVCGTANAAVSGANFGPFSNSGSCDYDCGFMTQTWEWSADFTRWAVGVNLLPAVGRMDAGAAYDAAFAPTTAWLAGPLPIATRQLIKVFFGTIQQIDEAIIKSGIETKQQTLALANAFAGAFASVAGCVAELNNALQSLATFVSGQSPSVGSLQNLIASMRTTIHNDINAQAENLENQLHCGQGEVQDQYNAMQTTLDATLVALGPPLDSVNSQFVAALSAASAVAGVFLNIQAKSQIVTDQITLAQGQPPTSPLRTLHLKIATNAWNDLADYARAQLAATTARAITAHSEATLCEVQP